MVCWVGWLGPRVGRLHNIQRPTVTRKGLGVSCSLPTRGPSQPTIQTIVYFLSASENSGIYSNNGGYLFCKKIGKNCD